MSAPSLHIESTDSMIEVKNIRKSCMVLHVTAIKYIFFF